MFYQGRISTSYTSPAIGVCVVRPTYMEIMDGMDVMDGNAGLKAQFEQGQALPFLLLVSSCAFSFGSTRVGGSDRGHGSQRIGRTSQRVEGLQLSPHILSEYEALIERKKYPLQLRDGRGVDAPRPTLCCGWNNKEIVG